MAECYLLLFDLSLYFTAAGFFLTLAAAGPPFPAFFFTLAAAIGLDALLRARKVYEKAPRPLRFLPLLLPLAALLFRPSLPQILHALPVWAYLSYSMITDRVHTSYPDFRSHMAFGMRLLLLLIFGIFSPQNIAAAFTAAVPYLICMLACGVCLLRMLREQRPGGLRQGVYMALFLLPCAALTLGLGPERLLRGLSFFYRTLIAPLIYALAVVLGALVYGLCAVFEWLISFLRRDHEPTQMDIRSAAETLGLEEQYDAYVADLRWLKTLLIVLGIALLVFLLFLVFRRLLGSKVITAQAAAPQDRESEFRTAPSAPRRPSLFRPRDPRLAVRWTYARFLAECRKRGLEIPEGMTASELIALSAPVFPGADVGALTSLYLPARYDLNRTVTQEEARKANELWKSIRRAAGQ